MSEKDNGGSAFPFVTWKSPDGMVGTSATGGMSLRDWFAGQVLGDVVQVFDKYLPVSAAHENFAKEAYQIADAMIAERNK